MSTDDLVPGALPQMDLKQGRLYILGALVNEEEKGEDFCSQLEEAKTKLTAADSSGGSTSKHRKKVRSLTGKLARCQKNERVLTQQLARNTSQMEAAGKMQWRTAFQEYSQSISPGFGSLSPTIMSPVTPFTPGSPMDLATTMQNMNLGFPITPGHNSPYAGYMSLDTAMQQTTAVYGPQIPPTPVMYPQGPFVHGIQPQYYYLGYVPCSDIDTLYSPTSTLVSPLTLAPETFESYEYASTDIQMEDGLTEDKVRPRSMSVIEGVIDSEQGRGQLNALARRFSAVE